MLLNAVSELLGKGGDILWVILFLSICLWSLICERIIYLKFSYPELQQKWVDEWSQDTSNNPKVIFYIRRYVLSKAKISMERFLFVIKMLIAICPMLGLLGTVTGMIHVFDVMAVTGTGNARSMAFGISQATISTMAGMVIAISGIYFYQLIKKNMRDKLHQLALLLN